MLNNLLLHIGKRIKLYRRIKNLTMEDLAKGIHKSKATLSKYEAGKISMDIATLFEIANALGVDINQLLDYDFPQRPTVSLMKNPFTNSDSIYLYFHDGRKNKIRHSLIKLHFNEFSKAIEATLFMDIASYSKHEECEYLYFGYMRPFDTVTTFILENQSTPIEQLTINMINPMKKFDSTFGLLNGIASQPLVPASVKVLLSKKAITDEEELRNLLILSKDDLRRIRMMNMYTVDLEFF